MIGGGRDIRKVIHDYAVKRENVATFLMVNNWIFRVDPKSLYVTPAGKLLINQQQRQNVVKLINDQDQEGSESYTSIKGRIGNNDKSSYYYYVQQIFLGQLVTKPLETELFFSTWYFTASNIIEYVRNFRTFTLVLMALDMDKEFVKRRPDFWFNQHPMARGGSWIDENSRGFSGSAAPSIGKLTNTPIDNIVELLKLEYLELGWPRWRPG